MTLIENVIPQQQAIIAMKISSSSTLDSNLSQMSISLSHSSWWFLFIKKMYFIQQQHNNNGADWEMKWKEEKLLKFVPLIEKLFKCDVNNIEIGHSKTRWDKSHIDWRVSERENGKR